MMGQLFKDTKRRRDVKRQVMEDVIRHEVCGARESSFAKIRLVAGKGRRMEIDFMSSGNKKRGKEGKKCR
jgi:hypothetical protein